ncbi:autotransporter domain-containing protein [Novacetimonas hansenii]|mgnify:CR=1 FL=1|uniref:autotransporter domain-containing protein n=2 Tax=Novacetimonas hansenii TaxID=436 RepID=UPI00248DD575|nr:autotransporter domain-containing protein [Novacetimonas hansenii]
MHNSPLPARVTRFPAGGNPHSYPRLQHVLRAGTSLSRAVSSSPWSVAVLAALISTGVPHVAMGQSAGGVVASAGYGGVGGAGNGGGGAGGGWPATSLAGAGAASSDGVGGAGHDGLSLSGESGAGGAGGVVGSAGATAYDNSFNAGGGGGGGAGVIESAGASVTSAITGGSGGGGGNSTWNGGGGGGGGGGAGVIATDSVTVSNVVTGGTGGNGGEAGVSSEGGGGGGGGGGDGLDLLASGNATATTSTNSASITGGAGGTGGAGQAVSGAANTNGGGGAGGVGVAFMGQGLTLANAGSITGGAGGTGGSVGAGGVGLVMVGGDTVDNSGSITGGMAGDGTTQADAILASGTGNALLLENGSTLSGNIEIAASSGLAIASGGAGTLNNAIVMDGASSALSFTKGTGDALDVSGVISGAGAVTVADGAHVVLSGVNSYAGGTTIDGGSLSISSDSALGNTAGSLSLTDNGNLETTANVTTARSITLGTGGGEISPDAGTTLNVTAPVSGTGGLTMDGAGALVLEGSNTYTGVTTISSGTLELSGAGSIATSGGVVDNGTLDISGSSMEANSVASLSGNGTVALGEETLVLTNASGTFGGVIADGGVAGGTSGSLNLTGGTETLTGVNTYTGSTQISSGTLALAGDGSIASSSLLSMYTGGVLDISGTSDGASVTAINDANATIALGGNTLTIGAGAKGVETPELLLAGGVSGNIVNGVVGPIVDGGISGGVGGGITLTNPGTSGSTVITIFGGENTYTGATTIGSGTALLLASASTLGETDGSSSQASIASSSRVVDNGIFDISLNSTVASNTSDTNSDSNSDTQWTIAASSTAITSLAGNGVVSLGSQNLLLTDASDTFSGTITNDSIANQQLGTQTDTVGGSLTLAGGHETLTGVNTYTGGTTIEAGTLTGTTASFGSGAIVDNGTLDIDQSTNGTLTNLVSGTGMLFKDGTGTLSVAQAETYTGATSINAGTLALTGDGSIATSSGVTLSGGTFDISGTTDGASIASLSGNSGGAVALGGETLTLTDAAGSFAGTIAGTGGVTLLDGHETLTGNNSYTGGTTITGGTLTGTTGSFGTGEIVDNGTLELRQSADGALTNMVSGTGALVIDSTGNMTLSGVNSYTGGTTLAGGALTVASASALSTGALNMAQGTTLNFGADGLVLSNALVLNGDPTVNVASGQGTLSGTLSDGTSPGDLVKVGAGTLILSGDSTYSGGTEIADGTLEVDGSIVSPVVADAGTTLAGTGTVGTTTISSGGTLSPGNDGDPMGTLTVQGNLTMAAGSNYVVNLSEDGGHDLVSVQGKATLEGGTVRSITADGSWNTNVRYTILSATDGVSGKFASVTSNLAFLNPILTYSADDVYLLLGRNTVSFASVGDTRNERAVGGAMDSISSGSLFNALVQTDASTARHALNGLSGELHASARTALIQDSYYIRDAAIERLRGADCERGAASGMKTASANGQRTDGACRSEHAALWMQAYGSFGHNAGDGNASGMGHSVGGFVLGADAPVLGWHVGGLVGYGHSTFDSSGVSSYGHSSNVSLGGYAGTHWGRLALRMGATYTWDMLSMTRNARFTGFSDRLSSRYNGGTAQAFGDIGYHLDAGPVGIEPFADIAYVNLHTDRFSEHGGAAALAGRALDTGVTYSTFGARFSSSFNAGGVVLMPNAMLGYRHAFGLTMPTAREAFMSGGDTFEVAGVPLAQDTAVVKLGLRAKLSRVLDIGLSYIGQYGRRSVDSGLTGNIRVKF